MTDDLTPLEYELLTRDLVGRFAGSFGVLTTRLEQNVVVPGKATRNQIDVLWEGEIAGSARRIVVECKHYKRRVSQEKIHAFRSVLDDINDGIPTTGVFVTKTGYQTGAQAVAGTYDIIVLELREPTREDKARRALRIEVTAVLRAPVMTDLHLECTEVFGVEGGSVEVTRELCDVEFADGTRSSLDDLLFTEHTSPLGQPPTPMHRVRLIFDPPADLLVADRRLLRFTALSAVVGDSDATMTVDVGPGSEGVAWVVKNALDGATAWFARDGGVHVVPPLTPRIRDV